MIFYLILMILHESKCSLVVDSISQRGVYVSEYCPKMEHCAEGAHIMCMYYNPDKIMGPRCANPMNVSMTADLANRLIDVSNAVRSKIALGKEKGKGGDYLPRGYGMFRLKWDNELATFAQVLANQCVLRHDLCRATKKFSDPGQTAGLVRFTFPDWYSVSNTVKFVVPGLNSEKLLYAANQTLKSWYGQKRSVTSEMITSYPDWTENPNKQDGRLYLEMIYGPATHMGCGISAYTEYAYYDNNAELTYNSVLVICNYSARPRKGLSVYHVEPPAGSLNRCGCPHGSIEDDDCLCKESPFVAESKPCNTLDCNPNIVLLPIFTVEDAPPQKFIYSKGTDKRSMRNINPVDDLNFFELPKYSPFSNKTHGAFQRKSFDQKHSVTSPKIPVDVKNRYFNMNLGYIQRFQNKQSPLSTTKYEQLLKFQKPSIFTRSAKFQLPSRKNAFPVVLTIAEDIKKDVSPRKDFSNIQKLVKSYLNKKRAREKTSTDRVTIKYKYKEPFIAPYDVSPSEIQDVTTDTYINTPELKVVTHNLKDLNKLNNHNYKSSINDDKKLMSLLNNLEQQVRHVQLDGTEKEIFDEKIRKIYGSLVGKTINFNTGYKINQNRDYTTSETDLYDSLDVKRSDIRRLKHKNLGTLKYGKEINLRHINNVRNRHTEPEPIEMKIRSLYTIGDKRKLRNRVRDLYKNERVQGKNDYPNEVFQDDTLSLERRKYYENKINDLKTKLSNTLKRNKVDNKAPIRRPVKSYDDVKVRSKAKSGIDSFYVPDRARFLHGF